MNERSVALRVSAVAQVNSLKSPRSKARSRHPHRLSRVLSDCDFVSKMHRRLHQSGSEGLRRKGQRHLKFPGSRLVVALWAWPVCFSARLKGETESAWSAFHSLTVFIFKLELDVFSDDDYHGLFVIPSVHFGQISSESYHRCRLEALLSLLRVNPWTCGIGHFKFRNGHTRVTSDT